MCSWRRRRNKLHYAYDFIINNNNIIIRYCLLLLSVSINNNINSNNHNHQAHRDLKPGKLLRYTSTCRYDDANMRRKQREESEEDQKMVYTDTSFVLVNDYHSFPHQIIFCLTGMATWSWQILGCAKRSTTSTPVDLLTMQRGVQQEPLPWSVYEHFHIQSRRRSSLFTTT